MSPSPSKTRLFSRPFFFVCLFYIGFICALYWPVLSSLSTHVLAGQKWGGAYCWYLWWWRYALLNQLPLFWTNFVMYPNGVPIFIHSPVNDLAAFFLQSFLSVYSSFNLLMLASYLLTALFSYGVFLKITDDACAAFCGSFLYSFSEYMLVEHLLGQVFEASIYFNPLFCLALLRLLDNPHWKNARWLGLAAVGLVLSSPYQIYVTGALFTVGVFLYDVCLGGKKVFQKKFLLWLAGIAIPLGLLTAFIYWPILKYSQEWRGAVKPYRLNLLSLIDLPFWHRSEFIQSLRVLKNHDFYSEQSVAYLGMGAIGLILYGLVKKVWARDSSYRFWLWIFGFSLVLGFGAYLEIFPDQETKIPLPYLLLSKLPVISGFRSISRIMAIVTLASSILAAKGFSKLTAAWSLRSKLLALASLVIFTTFEFDLPALAQRYVSISGASVYDSIKKDPERFAILELPSYYEPTGTLYPLGEYYMLFIPYHQKPIVLGYPSRYVKSSLQFTETTPAVFELTHPWLLEKLEKQPTLQGRYKKLTQAAPSVFREQQIKYVVLHQGIPGLPASVESSIKSFLEKSFGPSLEQDIKNRLLFRAYQTAETETKGPIAPPTK